MMYSPYIWPLILAAALMAGIALYVRGYKDIPAARPFQWLMWICVLWSGVYAVAICTNILSFRVYLGDTITLLAQCTSIFLLMLAIEYIGQGDWLTHKRVALLFVIPALISILAYTSNYHTLFRYNFRLDTSNSLVGLVYDRGPFFPIYILSFVVPNITAAVLLLRSAYRDTEHRWSTLLMIIGTTIPLIAGILFVVGITPIRGYDYSSTTIVITGIFVILALVRGRWLDVAKIARDNVIDIIEDLVVVLDNRNIIVDFNQAAKKTFNFDIPRGKGIHLDRLPQEYSALFNCCKDLPVQNKEVTLQTGNQPKIYDLTVSPIVDRRQQRLGRLFVFHDITDRKEIERELRENEEKFRALSDATTSGMYVFRDDRFILVNPAFLQITGYASEDIPALTLERVIHPLDFEMVSERAVARLRGEPVPKRYELRIVTKEGEERWIDLSATRITFGGQPASLGTIIDITERKVLEEELRISHALYLNIVEDQTDPVCRWLPDTTLTFVNQAYCAYFGRSREEFLGKRFMTWLPLESRLVVQGVIDRIKNGEANSVSKEEWNYDSQGNMRWMVWAYAPIKDTEENIIEFQSVGRDITDRKQAEEALAQVNEELAIQIDEIQSLQEELREQAVRDVLTGLFNRRYMEETLEREISGAIRSNHSIGLLMMDLDNFKSLNDTYGHKAGDCVLRALGNLFIAHTRHMDVACRYGGEEIVLIMPTSSLENAKKRAEQLKQAVSLMRVPFMDQVLRTTISIGIAGFPANGKNSDDILRAADDALYSAKAAGRDCIVVHPLI